MAVSNRTEGAADTANHVNVQQLVIDAVRLEMKENTFRIHSLLKLYLDPEVAWFTLSSWMGCTGRKIIVQCQSKKILLLVYG